MATPAQIDTLLLLLLLEHPEQKDQLAAIAGDDAKRQQLADAMGDIDLPELGDGEADAGETNATEGDAAAGDASAAVTESIDPFVPAPTEPGAAMLEAVGALGEKIIEAARAASNPVIHVNMPAAPAAPPPAPARRLTFVTDPKGGKITGIDVTPVAAAELVESGFTGVKTDSLDRKMYYRDGKHVASPSPAEKKEIEAARPDDPPGDVQTSKAAEEYKRLGTKAPAFKSWFGDWESDPSAASKVVKADGTPQETHEIPATGSATKGPEGKPVVVYHGTPAGGFGAFDRKKADLNGLYGPGFYFTEDRGVAEEYMSGGTTKTYRSIVVPADKRQAFLERFEQKAKAAGLDPHDADSSWSWEKTKSAFMTHGLLSYLGGNVINGPRMKLAVRLGPDLGAASATKAGQAPLETKEVYLNIRKPFDAESKIKLLELPKAHQQKVAAWLEETARASRASATQYTAEAKKGNDPKYFDGLAKGELERAETITKSTELDYGTLATALGGKKQVNAALQAAGYDGITHIGGSIMGDRPHRVWIAFEPTQIKAIANAGTFDPQSANIHESKGVA